MYLYLLMDDIPQHSLAILGVICIILSISRKVFRHFENFLCIDITKIIIIIKLFFPSLSF